MKIAVISRSESDLEHILCKYGEVTRISPEEKVSLLPFDACAVLGGTDEELLLLHIDLRLELERFRQAGKPVFAEWCASVGYAYADEGGMMRTVSHRMVYVGEDTKALHCGDLLDDRANTFVPFAGLTASCKPILCFGGHLLAHDKIVPLPEFKSVKYALWSLEESTLMCAFRFCNYVKARFAPHDRWDAVASLIVSHLVGREICVKTPSVASMDNSATSPQDAFARGLRWFDGAEILIDNGKSGALEGLSHKILPDGAVAQLCPLGVDCDAALGNQHVDAVTGGGDAGHARGHDGQSCTEHGGNDHGKLCARSRVAVAARAAHDVAVRVGVYVYVEIGIDLGRTQDHHVKAVHSCALCAG